MKRTIYVPDDLYKQAKAAGINVSAVCQRALRAAMDARSATFGRYSVECEDGSVESLPIRSLSARGAQRELTGYLINSGYVPVGRWEERDSESLRRVLSPSGEPKCVVLSSAGAAT